MHRPAQPVAVTEACVPNIGARGRRRRMRDGMIYLALGLSFSTLLVVRASPWWAWAPLALIYARAALGIFQAMEKT